MLRRIESNQIIYQLIESIKFHINDITNIYIYTGELGYDGLSGTRKIGPSYAKSVICI